MKISEILKTYKTDKASEHSYGDYYDDLFSLYNKDASISILELGVQGGGSVLAWKDYFKNAEVVGVDISDSRFDEYKQDRVTFIKSDLREALPILADKKFDIIIDDSDHFINTQIFIVKNYFSLLKDKGFMVIEDVQGGSRDINIIRSVLPEAIEMFVFDRRYLKDRYDDLIIEIQK